MRVLCTSVGSPSHARAMLPTVRALAEAGHDVLVAAAPTPAEVFTGERARVIPCLPDFRLDRAALRATFERRAGGSSADDMPEFLVSLAAEHYAATLPVAAAFAPDLVIRDGMDLGACLIAERFGVPHLPIPSGVVNTHPPESLLPGLNRLRRESGLPVHDDPMSLFPHGRLDHVPARYSFAPHTTRVFAYRQTVVDRAPVLPGWMGRLPGDRPLVLAAIGTALPMLSAGLPDGAGWPEAVPTPATVLRTLVRALSLLDCTAIVATGGLPVAETDAAPHVHLTGHVPQPLLLECADLFVTHGGYNGIREAMRTATPLVVWPQFGDQPHNARRVAELGLGREVSGTTPEGIAATCRDVLGDPAVTAAVRAARLAMLTLPGPERIAPDLERLVAGGAAEPGPLRAGV